MLLPVLPVLATFVYWPGGFSRGSTALERRLAGGGTGLVTGLGAKADTFSLPTLDCRRSSFLGACGAQLLIEITEVQR